MSSGAMQIYVFAFGMSHSLFSYLPKKKVAVLGRQKDKIRVFKEYVYTWPIIIILNMHY